MRKITGICIKSYQDEEDLFDFEEGKINENEIKVYNVGDEGQVVDGHYNKEFWKAKEEKL